MRSSSHDERFVVVGWCGVLCENCIVDASIKLHACCCHFFVWWWVCGLCDFCSFVFCVVHAGMGCGFFGLCFRVGCVFVIEGAWWMPWHAEPMKDV